VVTWLSNPHKKKSRCVSYGERDGHYRPIPVSCIWTTSNSFSSHVYTKITKKNAFISSKTAYPVITLDKCANISTPVSQVGGLVERRQYLVPQILYLRIFSYGDSLTITILDKTQCVFLHYGSSKHCTCPLNEFM
jgi:hypothetical protein